MKHTRLIFFLFIYMTSLSYTQKIQLFEDETGIQGRMKYSGTLGDHTLPKQGRVEINWRETDSTTLRTYLIRGQTRDHIPTGKWHWQEADWNYSAQVNQTIKPEFLSWGQQFRWEGTLAGSRPDGKWFFSVDSIYKDGKVRKDLIRMEIIYIDGTPVGEFYFENKRGNNQLELRGFCDDQGNATGKWKYIYKNRYDLILTEERIYEQGLLLEIHSGDSSTRSVITFPHNIDYITKLKNNIPDDLKRIRKENFNQDEFASGTTEWFHSDIAKYYMRGWDIDYFSIPAKRGLPKYRRLEYPLSPSEIQDIQECRFIIKSQRNAIEEQLADNIFIHRARNGELDTTISYLQLNLNRLHFIDSLLNRTEYPEFIYKNRHDHDLSHWITGLNKMRTTSGEVYDSLEVTLPLIIAEDTPVNIFRELKNSLAASQKNFPKYFETLDNARILLKHEDELKDIGNAIVDRFKNVQNIYTNTEGIGAEINRKWVKGMAQQMIQTFARTEDYDSAMQVSREIVSYLDTLLSWKEQLAEFNKMPETIRSLYTYLAYNPYTGAHDIEITIKKRFITNVLNDMWPYMLNEISEESDWNHWKRLWNRQFSVFEFLVEFVARDDKQAKRVNNRVRREKNPEKMLRIITSHIEEG